MTDKPETWNVHHFVSDDEIGDVTGCGTIEIEELNIAVNAAREELQSGNAKADPVAVAESYLARVERVPEMERVLRGILERYARCTCYMMLNKDDQPCFYCQIRAALGEK